MSPAFGCCNFEQPHNLTGGQVGVKLAGYTEKPAVDAFTGTRGTGEQIVEEWRQFARHGRELR